MLRAVCFDLWDTLIADPPGRGEQRAAERVRRLERSLRAAGWVAPPAAIADAVQAAVNALVGVHQDNVDLDDAARIDLFYRHLDPSLQPDQDLHDDARAEIAEAIHGGIHYAPPHLLPGARETLAALHGRGLRLALVSNTGFSPGLALRALLEELDLARYLTAHVYSDEVGAWKPDPRMFDEALFALGLPARDVLFVGDTPEADILGAQSAGLGLTALVGEKPRDGVRADLELPGVQDLLPALVERGAVAACPWTPRRRLLGWLALGLLAAAALAACGGDDRPTLTVFAAASLTDIFQQAAPAFESQEDVTLRFAFGGSQRLRFQLQQGARADLFASADREQMALAEADGLIAAAPIVFAANDLVLIVPAQNPAGVTAPADLLTTDLRLVVAAPDVPAGRLTRAFLQERGWIEAVLPAVVSQEDNVRAVLTKVAVAEADAGFVYASDAESASADLRAFALPTALRNDYLIAPLAGRAADPLVQRFLAFVAGEHVQALLRAAGFRPRRSRRRERGRYPRHAAALPIGSAPRRRRRVNGERAGA